MRHQKRQYSPCLHCTQRGTDLHCSLFNGHRAHATLKSVFTCIPLGLLVCLYRRINLGQNCSHVTDMQYYDSGAGHGS
jgi:hypothetical protein